MFTVALLLWFSKFIGSSNCQQSKPIVVLITGCSSGIGRSTAIEFAKNPMYKVWATMRNSEKWDHEEDKDNVVVASMDVTSEESVSTLVSRIINEDGKIDIVVNNAGYGLAGSLELAKIEEAKDLFDVNVWGVVRVLQSVLPHMRSKHSGHVINLSSTSGIRGIPCMEYYTGSKFALEGIMDSMRYSLSVFNVSVTNINAGPVRTSFSNRYGDSTQGGRGTRAVNEDSYLQSLTSRMVLGLQSRMDSPEGQTSEDVAKLIVNIAALRLKAKRLTDVPFNIGSSYDSQRLLEEVRTHPTGWGGVYSEILQSMPPLQPPSQQSNHEEL